MKDAVAPLGIRMDVWLWAARWFKTRSLAKSAIENGRVLLNERSCKASKLVCVGDCINLVRSQQRYQIKVLGVSTARGSAEMAQKMYVETEESQKARALDSEQQRYLRMGYSKPDTRPDKKGRRLIKKLQGQNFD